MKKTPYENCMKMNSIPKNDLPYWLEPNNHVRVKCYLIVHGWSADLLLLNKNSLFTWNCFYRDSSQCSFIEFVHI